MFLTGSVEQQTWSNIVLLSFFLFMSISMIVAIYISKNELSQKKRELLITIPKVLLIMSVSLYCSGVIISNESVDILWFIFGMMILFWLLFLNKTSEKLLRIES